MDISVVGEETVYGNQEEVGKDFLFDASFGLGVKILDVEDMLADLIELLNAPPAMVDVYELLERIALLIQQRSSQSKHAPRDFVFEQP